MMEKRRWSGEEYEQAREQTGDLEQLMRSILKLFADGCLVYRDRQQRVGSVQTKSDRLKRVRRRMVAMPMDPGFDGHGAVA